MACDCYEEETMDFKLIGSILLIIGTTIGAGMLALPIATAELGFVGSVVLLFACWFVMTAGALLILEINLWLPHSSNLISMARATIGPVGQLISWISFLVLLYTLLCAYIAGGSSLFHNLLTAANVRFPAWLSAVAFIAIFGTVVFMGIRTVDYVNRIMMFLKMGAYILLVVLLMPFISVDKLTEGHLGAITSASAILITMAAFGFAPIVPSLRIYFMGDVAKLKKAIFIGSIIPLICYILWDAAIMGVIPLLGDDSLFGIAHSGDSTSALVNTLMHIVPEGSVKFSVRLFTSIAVVTSFLGVGLCLNDFLADGLQLERKGLNAIFIHLLTFVPPLLVVIFFPGMFITALEYAGVDCIILLVLIPAWMAWGGRYKKHIAQGYRVPGGKPLLIGLIIFSIFLTVYGLLA